MTPGRVNCLADLRETACSPDFGVYAFGNTALGKPVPRLATPGRQKPFEQSRVDRPVSLFSRRQNSRPFFGMPNAW